MGRLPRLDMPKSTNLDLIEPREVEPDDFLKTPDDTPTSDYEFPVKLGKASEAVLTFRYDNPRYLPGEAQTEIGPDIVIRICSDGTRLRIEGLHETTVYLPPSAIVNFVKAALLVTNRKPHEVDIHISQEGLNAGQVDAVAALGAKAIFWGNFKRIEENPAKRVNDQAQWLDGYRLVSEEIANGKNEETGLDPTTHQRWLDFVDRYLQYALFQEEKDGLEATVDLFEAVRIQCLGVLGSLPNQEGKLTRQYVRFMTEYAGTLARLASCTNLKPYDSSRIHITTVGRDRNDDLFDHALRIYQEAKELIGEHPTDEEIFLTSSGIAHAEALRQEYLEQTERPLAKVIHIATARGKSRSNKHKKAAIRELEEARERINTPSLITRLDRQITDTHQVHLGHKGSKESSSPVAADEVLRDLVAAS